MRLALSLPLIAFLAACGVAGEPSHPDAGVTFSGHMAIGTSRSF
ncbi:argininosuccinate lyase [Pseudogemmobacter humi]|uniref:Lipoprotein n=1 Tax=Pseudogemmobacter humi TaxID=2483812 RepID=A0A3P5WQE7_9RHOB|nr:argininosuccinate lyase [Pseudogemmobacter humi]VDC23272.1 hypothetical protein XINFAN_00966 [Pseudogemmobacter humi]